jgi:RNA polymerase sigma factor (sigma-70 family)
MMIHREVRDLGGDEVDLFTTAAEAEQVAERLIGAGWPPDRARREAVRQAVSGALIGAIREGRGRARDRLVEVWLDEVYRWCRFNGGPGVPTEDATHDALLRMLEQLPRLRDPSRIRPWLWAITWRVLREHQRRSWFRRWVGAEDPQLADDQPALDQQVHAAERVERVSRILAVLPMDQRGLLFLAYVEGLSRPDLAEQLGVPLGTVNRRLTAARAAFADAARALDLDGAVDLDACGEGR